MWMRKAGSSVQSHRIEHVVSDKKRSSHRHIHCKQSPIFCRGLHQKFITYTRILCRVIMVKLQRFVRSSGEALLGPKLRRTVHILHRSWVRGTPKCPKSTSNYFMSFPFAQALQLQAHNHPYPRYFCKA